MYGNVRNVVWMMLRKCCVKLIPMWLSSAAVISQDRKIWTRITTTTLSLHPNNFLKDNMKMKQLMSDQFLTVISSLDAYVSWWGSYSSCFQFQDSGSRPELCVAGFHCRSELSEWSTVEAERSIIFITHEQLNCLVQNTCSQHFRFNEK